MCLGRSQLAVGSMGGASIVQSKTKIISVEIFHVYQHTPSIVENIKKFIHFFKI